MSISNFSEFLQQLFFGVQTKPAGKSDEFARTTKNQFVLHAQIMIR